MTLRPCPHEKEVVGQLALGHYPQACTSELRAHVASCRSCSDLVLITRSFQTARTQTVAAANLASPGLLWWRAQLRRRNAAVERIGKPILGAQIFALSVSVLFAIGFLESQATQGLHWLTWLHGASWLQPLPQVPALHLEALWPSGIFNSGWSLPIWLPVLATLALLSGVILYLASEKQ